jgi:hypothetical protein
VDQITGSINWTMAEVFVTAALGLAAGVNYLILLQIRNSIQALGTSLKEWSEKKFIDKDVADYRFNSMDARVTKLEGKAAVRH